MLKKILISALILILLGAIVTGGALAWGYFYITRDLPKLSSIEDYQPKTVSLVYADDGTPIAEFYEERRYPAKIEEIPIFVRNCFLAAEDASFYRHPGIDPVSILRAMVRNFQSGAATQGGSTITQQVVKNLLLSPERKIQRKIKEAILSYQLEQRLSKDEILEMYLNQIFFGNGAYGIKAAAQSYFHKSLDQLTLAEAAMLAGLPKAPSSYSPVMHSNRAKRRQRYVLDQMVKAGFITREVADTAFEEEVKRYPASSNNIFHAPYYVAEVRRILGEKWKRLNPDVDGLKIYTALNLKAEEFAVRALKNGLREVDKRRGWRGPIKNYPKPDPGEFLRDFGLRIPDVLELDNVYPALVTKLDRATGIAQVTVGEVEYPVALQRATWARRLLTPEDRVSEVRLDNAIRPGDVIEFSLKAPAATPTAPPEPNLSPEAVLDQTPEIEGAVALLDPNTGKVTAVVGGYSFQRSKFNRVTQSYRQPGSTFKPVVYLAAVDGFKYTPATIVHDTPRTFRVGDEFWTPGNFDEKFMGGITLRTALEKSRNLVSADIVSRIGIEAIIRYAKLLGIESRLGNNLSLSLGSSEITLLELTRAYGVFAAKGVLADSVLITRIEDRKGNVIFDYEEERLNHARKVISAESAFIMSNLMKGVVEHGTGYRVREIGRPVAGKTGTSNDEMDAWFIGFTPNWVAGVWVGFDVKRNIGNKETGGRVSAPIWLQFMRDFLNYSDAQAHENLVAETKAEAERLGIEYVEPEPLAPLDFSVPEGVDPYWIDKSTGLLSSADTPGAFLEYFTKGTEPNRALTAEEDSSTYLQSPDL